MHTTALREHVDGGAGTTPGAPARRAHRLPALLRRRFVKAFIVANLVVLLLLPLREAGWLQGLELSWYDTLVSFFAGSQQSDRVVLVALPAQAANDVAAAALVQTVTLTFH